MPSLIESLIGSGVVRPDTKRLVPTRRPMPARPRDLLELFAALGAEATLPSLFQATQIDDAEPRTLAYLALSRWPTEAELAGVRNPYEARAHLRALLGSAEFRAGIVRRICDAYPERPRMLFVRIPRCAGAHFLTMASHMHPIVPAGLGAATSDDTASFYRALGTYLGRFTLTKSIMLVQPSLAWFTDVPRAPDFPVPAPRRRHARAPDPTPDHADAEARAASGMAWNLNPPPRRVGDRLFTILREPASLILSEVNATLDALLQPPEADTPDIAAWRARLPANPATADQAGLKHIAREILRQLPMRNPICHALADGTAAAAFRAVRLQDVELADLSHYPDWTKYTWDVEPEPATNTSIPHLTLADLTPADREHLDSLIAEDLRFYAPVRTALDKLDGFKNAVRGRDL